MKRKAAFFINMAMVMVLLAALTGCVSDQPPKSIPPVSGFDVERYMGTWYEIARLPQWFERNLNEVKAEYTLLSNGTVKVVNSGIRDGEIKRVEGVVRFKGLKTVGDLEVSFFKPFYGDYRIIRLAEDYHYAIVTSKTRESLWILSRKPQLPQDELAALLAYVAGLDFDISKLEYPNQTAK